MRVHTDARTLASNIAAGLPGGRWLWDWYTWRSAQTHVISYPKSGRTWLRFSLGRMFCESFGLSPSRPGDVLEPHRLARLDSRVPRMRFSHDAPYLTAAQHHDRDRSRYGKKDVIFLARDPRDVVVSSYHHHTTRAATIGDPRFEGPLVEFLTHPIFGIESIIAFMNAWAVSREIPRRFLLVRYEDMADDLAAVLRRIVGFLGLESVTDDAILSGVSSSTFENMRALEGADALGSALLRAVDQSDPSSFKVRRGRVGGYAEELKTEEQAFVDSAVSDRLDAFFGYAT